MKISRNDPCPCGSGKKYKQCCLNSKNPSNEYELIRTVVSQGGYSVDLADSICNLLRYMKEKTWIGACHATCAALYVSLVELGYGPKLCMGEVEIPSFVFDHSWIELDGRIIDIAVSMTLIGGGLPISNPVVLDINICTGEKYDVMYGTRNGRGLDPEAGGVASVSFCRYMDSFPDERNGLWGVVEKILEKKIDIELLKDKYKNTKWEKR